MQEYPDNPVPAPASADLFQGSVVVPTAPDAYPLLHGRNRQIGSLMLADRVVFYLHILHAMLLCRREHELEPLYEDIFQAVHQDLGEFAADGEYLVEHFRSDLDQLQTWGLITSRIEIERLRGYRDTRKRKFRYSLTEETVAFMEWLEARQRAESEHPDEDARDVLEDIGSGLNELLRNLECAGDSQVREGDPRRILYQLFKLEERSLAVNGHLGTFNARLLGFVIHHYEIGEAKHILRDLEDFVEHFLRQVHELRGSLVERMEKLVLSRSLDALRTYAKVCEEEYGKVSYLIRQVPDPARVEKIPFRLLEFYREGGKLDLLCRRIHDSSLKVWRKLHSHLRELERRSSRMDDLRARIAELAASPEERVPTRFLLELICPAGMPADPHYWDGHEDADPPAPRRYADIAREPVRKYLGKKRRAAGPVTSMEQARLQHLGEWMITTLGQPGVKEARPLSGGAFTSMEDLFHVMELSKTALLGNGRKLRRLHYVAETDPETERTVNLDDASLSFRELFIRRAPGDRAE